MSTQPTPESVLLSSLTRLMTQWSSVALHAEFARDAGITIDAGDVQPVYLLGLDGPKRASDLAAALRLSRPTMTKQLTRLESAGFVARHPDPDDGRAVIVALTDEGTRAFDALVERGLTVVHANLADWSDTDRRQLATLAHRFVTGLTGPDDPTEEPRSGEES